MSRVMSPMKFGLLHHCFIVIMCILVKDLFVLLLHDVSKADLLLSFLSPRWEMWTLTYWRSLSLCKESLLSGELMHRHAAKRAARCSAGNDRYAADRTQSGKKQRCMQCTCVLQRTEKSHVPPHASHTFSAESREDVLGVCIIILPQIVFLLNTEQFQCPVTFYWCWWFLLHMESIWEVLVTAASFIHDGPDYTPQSAWCVRLMGLPR